jgi:hypothetical protein
VVVGSVLGDVDGCGQHVKAPPRGQWRWAEKYWSHGGGAVVLFEWRGEVLPVDRGLTIS